MPEEDKDRLGLFVQKIVLLMLASVILTGGGTVGTTVYSAVQRGNLAKEVAINAKDIEKLTENVDRLVATQEKLTEAIMEDLKRRAAKAEKEAVK